MTTQNDLVYAVMLYMFVVALLGVTLLAELVMAVSLVIMRRRFLAQPAAASRTWHVGAALAVLVLLVAAVLDLGRVAVGAAFDQMAATREARAAEQTASSARQQARGLLMEIKQGRTPAAKEVWGYLADRDRYRGFLEEVTLALSDPDPRVQRFAVHVFRPPGPDRHAQVFDCLAYTRWYAREHKAQHQAALAELRKFAADDRHEAELRQQATAAADYLAKYVELP